MTALSRNESGNKSSRSPTVRRRNSLRNNLWQFSLIAISFLGLSYIPFYETEFDRMRRPWLSRSKLLGTDNTIREHALMRQIRTLQLSATGDHLTVGPHQLGKSNITSALNTFMISNKRQPPAFIASTSLNTSQVFALQFANWIHGPSHLVSASTYTLAG